MQVQSIGLGVIPQPVDDDQLGPEVESVYIPGPRGYHDDGQAWFSPIKKPAAAGYQLLL